MSVHFVEMHSSAEVPFDGRERRCELFGYAQGEPTPGTGRIANAMDCSARAGHDGGRWGQTGGPGALRAVEVQLMVLDAREHSVELPEVREAVLRSWLGRPVGRHWRRPRVRLSVAIAERVVFDMPLTDVWLLAGQPVFASVFRYSLAHFPHPVSRGDRISAELRIDASRDKEPPVNVDARVHVRMVLLGTEGKPSDG